MSTHLAERIRCDLCNYGGEWTHPSDFVKIDRVDLCHWCAEAEPIDSVECGGHTVTFNDAHNHWTCSCGARYIRPFFVGSRVRVAVPNMPRAAANFHVQNDGASL